MTFYALDEATFDEVRARIGAATSQIIPEAFLTRVSRRVARGEHMFVAGNTAAVPIVGVIEKSPSFFSFMFGATTLQGDIIQAINDANANDQVENIVLEIDSPGGVVEGLQGVIDAISGSDKPVVAMVTDKALSAGFWIASQASVITVNNTAASVGGLGVVARVAISEDIVTLTSTKAPGKAPDAATEAGQAEIVARLDEIHDRFAADVASGRGVSVADVNTNFGQGRTVLAEKALAAGMIDGIGVSEISPPAAAQEAEGKESVMDLQKLKADHANVYEAAVAEGVVLGRKNEKDRVDALLHLGAESGDMDRAIEAVEKNESINGDGGQKLQAHFMMAAVNKKQGDDRAADNADEVAAGAESDGDEASAKDVPEVLEV